MTPDEENAKLRHTVGQLVNQIAALLAAGEKMEAALNQCRAKPHVLREWQAVVAAIGTYKAKST